MVNIGSTLPPSATTPVSKKKITPSSREGEGRLSSTRTSDDTPKQPAVDRRKNKDRRQQRQGTLMDSRSGRGRRETDKAPSSVDISI